MSLISGVSATADLINDAPPPDQSTTPVKSTCGFGRGRRGSQLLSSSRQERTVPGRRRAYPAHFVDVLRTARTLSSPPPLQRMSPHTLQRVKQTARTLSSPPPHQMMSPHTLQRVKHLVSRSLRKTSRLLRYVATPPPSRISHFPPKPVSIPSTLHVSAIQPVVSPLSDISDISSNIQPVLSPLPDISDISSNIQPLLSPLPDTPSPPPMHSPTTTVANTATLASATAPPPPGIPTVPRRPNHVTTPRPSPALSSTAPAYSASTYIPATHRLVREAMIQNFLADMGACLFLLEDNPRKLVKVLGKLRSILNEAIGYGATVY